MLSTTSEYALRSLAYLASQPKGKPVLGRDLAEHCDIPSNYLSKILLALRNAGFIDTVRGSRGGYSLHRAAHKVRLIEVVELFDGPRARPECFLGGHKKCSDENPCAAHPAWREVRNAYVQLLETTTVLSLSGQNGQPAAVSPERTSAKGKRNEKSR